MKQIKKIAFAMIKLFVVFTCSKANKQYISIFLLCTCYITFCFDKLSDIFVNFEFSSIEFFSNLLKYD